MEVHFRAFLLFSLLFNGLALADNALTYQTPPAELSSDLPNARQALSDRFGVTAHLRFDPSGIKLLPAVPHAGFSTLRFGEQWDGVEKQKGVYTPDSFTDNLVSGCGQLGLEPLFLLAYGNQLYADSLDPNGFANYAIWLMDRYKGKIKYWEIWNEPNNFFFRKHYGGNWNGIEKDGKESPWVGKFADFVTIVAQRIKAVHPEVKLMTGDAMVSDLRMILNHPKMFENLDILSIHPYEYRLPPELQPFGGEKILARDGIALAGPDHSFKSMIQIYRDALASIGHPEMPIWVTEEGYSTFIPKTPITLWAGMTENTQAVYEARFGILAASLGVEKTLFYVLVDTGDNDAECEHRFGLIRRDLSPKPSYLAIQRMTSLMPGDTRRISLPVKLKRLSPTTRTGATQWETQEVAYLDEPQLYSFKRPDGKFVVFLWRSGPIYADLQEERCELQFDVKSDSPHVLEVGRVGSGEKLDAKSQTTDGTLVVSGLRYGSDPLYVLLGR